MCVKAVMELHEDRNGWNGRNERKWKWTKGKTWRGRKERNAQDRQVNTKRKQNLGNKMGAVRGGAPVVSPYCLKM